MGGQLPTGAACTEDKKSNNPGSADSCNCQIIRLHAVLREGEGVGDGSGTGV